MKKKNINNSKNSISRRKAVVKLGSVAITSATMMLLLNTPNKLQAQDSSDTWDEPGDPGNF